MKRGGMAGAEAALRATETSTRAGQDGLALADDVARLLLSRGLVARTERGIVLTDAGRAWLRRQRATDDPYRVQHQERAAAVLNESGGSRRVVVNRAESPLGWLRSRKDRNGQPLIAPEQFAAGERLRADHWRAHLSPRVTANWEASAPSRRSRREGAAPSWAVSDEVIAAKQRVARALEAVGPELSGILVSVCCELQGLEQAERDEGWPQRAGKIVLQLALTRLARHYGLMAPANGQRPSRMRHWGSEDYRPRLHAET